MKRITGALLALTLATPVFAENTFFGEILLGTMDNDATTSTTGTFLDNSFSDTYSLSLGGSTALGLGGGYHFTGNFAIEAGYRINEEANYSDIDDLGDTINGSAESTTLQLGIRAALPLSDAFSLNAKLGFANWDLDIESTNSSALGETFRESESGNDLYYGIGIEYAFNKKFSIGLEYSAITMEWKENETNEFVNYTQEIEYEVSGFSLLGRMYF